MNVQKIIPNKVKHSIIGFLFSLITTCTCSTLSMAEKVPTAIASEALANLKQQLTCPICLDHYTQPRTLPCLHSTTLRGVSRVSVPSQLLFDLLEAVHNLLLVSREGISDWFESWLRCTLSTVVQRWHTSLSHVSQYTSSGLPWLLHSVVDCFLRRTSLEAVVATSSTPSIWWLLNNSLCLSTQVWQKNTEHCLQYPVDCSLWQFSQLFCWDKDTFSST